MGKQSLSLVTDRKWLDPFVYATVGLLYVVSWFVRRTGLADRWNKP